MDENEVNPHKGEDNYGLLFANNKVQFDNMVQTAQVNNATAAISLQQAVAFQQKANDMYLANADAREKQRLAQGNSEHNQRLEHENEIETTRQENMRYTLNYLYGVEGAEALGNAALARAIAAILKAEGYTARKEE